MDKVGEKIYNLRKDKGLSQDKLAEMLCVSRPTISRWENDAVQPTTENIESLCKIFNVDSNYFFDNVDGLAVTKEIDDQDIVGYLISYAQNSPRSLFRVCRQDREWGI